LEQILNGRADANVGFSDLCNLLLTFGFNERIKGSHHIYSKAGVEEIINIQPNGNKAKPYQVKQVRGLILKYRLGGALDE
jgi:predicted RNA binding protein YcfA (HicA-like mRNA interferase family)